MDREKAKEMGMRICIPGMRLSALNKDYVAGTGTHELRGYIYATLAGVLRTTVDEKTKVTTVTVEGPKSPSVMPKSGDIVTAKVTVVNPRQVNCAIICIGPYVLTRSYRGVLKKEEIRATDKDRTDPYKCYKSGDVILAKVLPMTEINVYHLSTSENDLGVVIATAEGSPPGVNMVPTSWSEMQCPQTLIKEPRKVARVIPDKELPKIKLETLDTKENEIGKEVSNEEMK